MNLHTKALMRSSALVTLCLGAAATFAPQELVVYGDGRPEALTTLMVQAAGALYLGFAMVNWMAKDSLVGGIYSRPVALGNLVHFLVLTVALLKVVLGAHPVAAVTVIASIYLVLTVWFGIVVFTSPVVRSQSAPTA